MAKPTPENTVHLVGNLTEDPELRYTQSGVAVANGTVAVNRRVKNGDEWEDATDGFFRFSVWRDYAENVHESLHKGDRVYVVGRLSTRSYEDSEGVTKWVTEVEAEEVMPSLRWATANVSKVKRGGGGRQKAPQQQSGGGWGGNQDSGGSGWDAQGTPDDVPF